ncbi:MAG: radical SAM protein [Actinobacteria bacterium]|nr:MAG: radical SAM protein [Actinomycetota bacterium]
MKIVFINPYISNDKSYPDYPPIGILSMSSLLKEAGYSVFFLDAQFEQLSVDQISAKIKKIVPDLIGITINVVQAKSALVYINELKKIFPSIPLVIGGPFVTGFGKETFDHIKEADFAVQGEGEEAIVNLVNHLDGRFALEDIDNLIYKNNGQIITNPLKRIFDINALPLPDYDLIKDHINLYTPPHPSIAQPSMHIMCSRGCPFKCQFCSSPTIWGRKVIYRNVESVIEEVDLLISKFGVKEIFFQDDTLNARKKWFFELCHQLIETKLNEKAYFKCPFRVNKKILSRELLQIAKKANFWMIFYGVENGNQAMLQSMNKGIKIRDIKRAFDLSKQVGIKTFASFMVGNIGETEETYRDSINLMKEIKSDYGGFAFAIPFPGSELYNVALSKRHIEINDFVSEFTTDRCIVRTDKLDSKRIQELTMQANQLMVDKN